ncbi:hypothetical protein ACO2JO_03285 [Leptospira interrogans]
MARLPLIDPVATDGDICATVDWMLFSQSIFRMMAHAEAGMVPAMRLCRSILRQHDAR